MGIVQKIVDYGKILLNDYEQSTLLKQMEREHNDARANQMQMRKRWDWIEAYVEGRQIKDKNGILRDHLWGSAESDTRSFDDQFLVVNDVLRVHLSNQQRLSSYRLDPDLAPNDKKDPDDKNGARIGKIALSDFIRRQGESKLRKRIARLIDLYGTVFIKTYFDASAGRMVPKPEKKEDGSMGWSEKEFQPEGEMKWKIVSPRNILLPKWSSDLSKVDWVEEISVETVSWVYRNYNKVVKAEGIKLDDTTMLGSSFSNIAENKSESESPVSTDDKLVLVKERYYRPSTQFPRGAIFIWANNVMLRSSTLLDFYDDIPYESAEMIFDDKDVFGDTTLWHLIPLQDSLNQSMTAILRHVKASAILRGWMPEEANIDEKSIDDSTARWVKYSGKIKPDYDRPPEVQETFFAYMNQAREFIMSHGFAQDISRRKGALSGNAIAALQEIDDTIMRPTLESVEQALKNSSVKVLKGMAKNYGNNRMIKMTGRSGWVYEKFRGEMLHDNFDAHISLMTGLPSNKNFRLEFLTKLKNENILTVQEVRQHMEFGSSDEVLEEIQKNNEVAESMIEMLANYPDGYHYSEEQGREISKVIPHVWDNHDVMIKALLEWMRENYDHSNKNVQQESEYLLQFHQQGGTLARTPIAGQPGAADALKGDQPVPGMPLSPEATEPEPMPDLSPEMSTPGSAIPQTEIAQDSLQAANQQPDRSMIPDPGVSGLRQF